MNGVLFYWAIGLGVLLGTVSVIKEAPGWKNWLEVPIMVALWPLFLYRNFYYTVEEARLFSSKEGEE